MLEAAILGLRQSTCPEQAHDIIGTARRYYQSEKRFRALIENSSDAISLLDPEGEHHLRQRVHRARAWVSAA